jgi:hypothetical protein
VLRSKCCEARRRQKKDETTSNKCFQPEDKRIRTTLCLLRTARVLLLFGVFRWAPILGGEKQTRDAKRTTTRNTGPRLGEVVEHHLPALGVHLVQQARDRQAAKEQENARRGAREAIAMSESIGHDVVVGGGNAEGAEVRQSVVHVSASTASRRAAEPDGVTRRPLAAAELRDGQDGRQGAGRAPPVPPRSEHAGPLPTKGTTSRTSRRAGGGRRQCRKG